MHATCLNAGKALNEDGTSSTWNLGTQVYGGQVDPVGDYLSRDTHLPDKDFQIALFDFLVSDPASG